MIRELFLPEKIGDYVLFKRNVVALSIGKQTVTATCMNFHAQKRELIATAQEPIAQEEYEDFTTAAGAAVQKVIKTIGKYDELIVVADSSYATFKELTVSLLDEEKIAQVLGFELESYLPFPINQAVFDFIVTRQDFTEKKSEIFAGAVPQERIQHYIDVCTAAGISPTKITLDVFNIFALYTVTTPLHATDAAQFIITQEEHRTITLYLENKVLKKVRLIQEPAELGNTTWWNDLNFTLNSCRQNWNAEVEIIFYASFSQEFLGQAKMIFDTPCTLLNTDQIIQSYGITAQGDQGNLQNLASALKLSLLDRFNLLPAASFITVTWRSASKYIAMMLLICTLYGSLAVHTVLEVRRFGATSQTVSDRILKNLKTALPALKVNSLNEALRKAKAEIAKEEDIWFAFSSQTQHSFLTYLFELSIMIDRDTLGLDLRKMVFNKNGITLEGKVRSFDAVEEFIKQLKNTHLFAQVPNLQKTEFSVLLPLENQGGQS